MKTKLVVTGAAAVLAGALLGAAPAAADPAELGLDDAATARTAADLARGRQDCTTAPGGAVAGSDTWIFGQPVPGAVAGVYTIGLTGTDDRPVLVSITGFGLLGVAPPGKPGGPLITAPVPDGVDGGFLGGGSDGAWLRTPAGWRVSHATLTADPAAPAAPTTFGLTGVCPASPGPASSPGLASSPGPASSSGPASSPGPVSPSAAATVDPVATPGAPPRWAPATGGGLLAIGGLLLALVARRRSRTSLNA